VTNSHNRRARQRLFQPGGRSPAIAVSHQAATIEIAVTEAADKPRRSKAKLDGSKIDNAVTAVAKALADENSGCPNCGGMPICIARQSGYGFC
jgi:hypothetical protein